MIVILICVMVCFIALERINYLEIICDNFEDQIIELSDINIKQEEVINNLELELKRLKEDCN